MAHLSHLKHIQRLEMVGAKGLQVEKVELMRLNGEWVVPGRRVFDWYFYLVDGKFVLNHPHTAAFKHLQNDVLATLNIDDSTEQSLLEMVNCKARVCSKLNDGTKSNQRLFLKPLDSTIIVQIDIQVNEGVSFEDLPEQVMLTSEWLHEGQLFWVTNMPYDIHPSKSTFNALKISEDTPAGNWHVKLYLRDECFASLSFRIDDSRIDYA